MIRRIVAVTLVITTTWINLWAAAPGWAAYPAPRPRTADEALARLDRFMDLAEELRSSIDRSQIDLEVLLDVLGYDAESIIQFVENEIFFEQYQGSLRGPRGTLISRSGNALDQSTLLAKLLKDAGYEARIKGGEIDAEIASDLLLSMSAARREVPPISDPAAVDRLEASLRDFVGPSSTGSDRRSCGPESSVSPGPLQAQAERSRAIVTKHLEQAGLQIGDPGRDAKLLQETRQHYWVEYRLGPTEAWVGVDPAMSGTAKNVGDRNFNETFTDSIPSELQHRLRIEVFIEQAVKGRLKASPITDVWERPTANLVGVPITFLNLPNPLLNNGGEHPNLVETLQNTQFIIPTLMGAPAPGAEYFDLAGNILDPMAAFDPAAGVFREVNRSFGQAIGALEGGESNPISLTAQWIRFTLIAPGGKERQFDRTTLDLIGPSARDKGVLPDTGAKWPETSLLPLLRRYTFMIATGRHSETFLLAETLDQLLEARPFLKWILQELEAGKPQVEPPAELLSPIGPDWRGMLPLFALFDREPDSGADRVYRSEPTLAMYSDGPAAGGRHTAFLDVLSNKKRAVRPEMGKPILDAGKALATGVWETEAETALFPAASPQTFGTSGAITRAQAADIPIVVLRPGDSTDRIDLDSDAEYHISQDLRDGYAIVVPQTIPEGDSMTGWWRVDPNTGETLGRLSDGRGGSPITEWLVANLPGIATLVSIMALYYGWYGCFQNRTPGSKGSLVFLCCLAANYAGYALGIGLGMAFARAFYQVEVALYSIAYDGYTSQLDLCSWMGD